ncbi:hypothetical protein [Novipirellula artificiosorum]|uniref:Uncharacterized protein n=1 Tax=Novipirellula artificiosorum TaxID=2528016 RepID=A0A5C6DM13_9BACT|nr:hypothetical protein [Novipirellula artificiosorum]TWU37215.1 hypothetical protein Poly41_33430 [Novipirellula artificiosorum]
MSDPVQNPYLSPTAASAAATESTGTLLTTLRTNQIIAIALIQGVLLITAILAFMTLRSAPNANPAPVAMPAGAGDLVLPLMGAVLGAGSLVASMLVSKIMRQASINRFIASKENVPRPIDENITMTPAIRKLVGAASATRIVALAILEGAAVFNAILMLLDGYLALHLAVITVCIFAMGVRFPTLRKRLDLIEEVAS